MCTVARTEFDQLTVGATAACELQVTRQCVDAFAAWSEDNNPLHMDDAFARECGFEGRVAHGMVALGAISRLIGTQLPGPGALWMSQQVDFVSPVLIGDCLVARVTITQRSQAARVVVLATEVAHKQSGVVVLRGAAKVRIPANV